MSEGDRGRRAFILIQFSIDIIFLFFFSLSADSDSTDMHGHGQRTYSDKDDQWGSGGDPESGPRSADSGPYTRLMGTFSFKSYIFPLFSLFTVF